MTVRAAWLTETGQTREDTRVTLSGLLTPNALVAENIPLKARGGIVPGGFALTGTTGSMTFTIGTGRAFVQGGRTGQGVYPVAVTEPETLTVPDGDSLYSRIDLVELVVLDSVYDGTLDTTAQVRLVKGDASATPVAPTSPNGSALPLYRITVPAKTSAGSNSLVWDTAVVSLRYPTVALGGIVPAEGFSGAYVGQYREDSAGLLQRWNGTAWQYAEGRSTVLLSVSQTSAQSVTTGPWTQITLQSTDVDDATAWSGSNTYTVPRAGWWRVTCAITWFNEATTGSRGARVYVNGSGVPRGTWLVGAGPGATSVGGTCLLKLAAGDKLALYGLQNSGSTLTTLGGSGYSTNLTAEWLRS
ncbi:hypothetical protein ACFYWX_27470 [Streptomyces sp. NPDC002888]|uniref:hypothetical protein n=1 Tax=Streptomyces sp. NPDC002888 TaxID=3364668 RepID=UPI0036D1C166